MTHPSPSQSCPYFPHLGPIGCLPAPNIFPLAKETFAKGKMFLNDVFDVVVRYLVDYSEIKTLSGTHP